ncbi:hypothetical protein AAK899_09370 [Erysipelotrichaceae bacterium 51-3]
MKDLPKATEMLRLWAYRVICLDWKGKEAMKTVLILAQKDRAPGFISREKHLESK